MEKTHKDFAKWCSVNGIDASRYWDRGRYHYAKREAVLAFRAFKAGADSRGKNNGK